MTRVVQVLPSTAVTWLRANPDVGGTVRSRLGGYGKALPDAVLEDPSRLRALVVETTVEALRRDAPPGVVEELEQIRRTLTARLAWLASHPGVAHGLRSLQGLRDHREVAPALRDAIGRATDPATRAGLARMAVAADRAAVFLGPDGVESGIVPAGAGTRGAPDPETGTGTRGTGTTGTTTTDPGTSTTGTTDTGTTDTGTTGRTTRPTGTTGRTTDPGTSGRSTVDPGSDPAAALAETGAALGRDVAQQFPDVPDAEATGAARGAQAAVEMATSLSSGGPVGGVGDGASGDTFTSRFWGLVGSVVGGALGGPAGALIGYGFGQQFGSTPVGIGTAQLLGSFLEGAVDAATGGPVDLTTAVACVVCGPECIVCVLAGDMGAPPGRLGRPAPDGEPRGRPPPA